MSDMPNPQNLTPMDKMKIGDLVNLTIGEEANAIEQYEVLRVHGGWLYTRITLTEPLVVGNEPQKEVGTTCFVPEPPSTIQLGEFNLGKSERI